MFFFFSFPSVFGAPPLSFFDLRMIGAKSVFLSRHKMVVPSGLDAAALAPPTSRRVTVLS